MASKLRFHPDVVTDLAEAIAWYDERSPGLGDRFRAAVNRNIGKLFFGRPLLANASEVEWSSRSSTTHLNPQVVQVNRLTCDLALSRMDRFARRDSFGRFFPELTENLADVPRANVIE
jgi:hypothetical protein